ncbi:hypothetical protein BDV29DRAFT_159771 [Aspergillus leporis]|uniref:SnoaL-like domain-containing protein n=1 Tax=Aspergillus leporis TaxID=41062 RepID=A0A5N5WVG7_9EURO|nr:hypothetical protein BDV29DRAFT_159771 [Aspergillus leporis]
MPPSETLQTALTFLSGFKTLAPEPFLVVLSPTAIHEFAPSSCSPPPPKDPPAFVNRISSPREILASFKVAPKEIWENEKGQVTISATSEAVVRDEVRDEGISGEEWRYRGEYIYVFEMDEDRERIVRVVEILDIVRTGRLRGLMGRARGNPRREGSEGE